MKTLNFLKCTFGITDIGKTDEDAPFGAQFCENWALESTKLATLSMEILVGGSIAPNLRKTYVEESCEAEIS